MKNPHRMNARTPRGVSVIVLITFIAFLLVVPAGIFVFELNRFQFIQQQLERACDAAALAGGTRLIEADPGDTTDDTVRIARRQHQAVEAAKKLFTRQVVVSIPAEGNTSYDVDTLSTPAPNKYAIRAVIIDPDKANEANNGQVNFGDPKGRAVLVQSRFNEIPAFGRYLGLSAIPVFAQATSALPRLDVMLVLDASGSMDDCTRVTFVQKRTNLTREGQQKIEELGPPPPLPDTSACDEAFASGCSDNYAAYDGCIQGICGPFEQTYQAYIDNVNQIKANYSYMEYAVKRSGRLRDILERVRPPAIGKYGTAVNALAHHHYSILNDPYFTQGTGKNTWELTWTRGNGPSGSDCDGDPDGFDYIVVNLPKEIQTKGVSRITQNPRPIFGDEKYPQGGYTDIESGLQFPNLPTLVEASTGNLNGKQWWEILDPGNPRPTSKIYINTLAQYGNLPGPNPRYQERYTKCSRPALQPAACVIEASKLFVQALAGSGKNVRVGLVGFETKTSDTPNPIYDPATHQFGFTQLKITDPDEPNIDRYVQTFAPRPTDRVADVNAIKTALDEFYSLRATGMTKALTVAHDTLLGMPGANARRQVIVLLTDGMPTLDSPQIVEGKESYDAKPEVRALVSGWPNNRVALYTVGFAQDQAVIGEEMRDFLNDGVTPTLPGNVIRTGGIADLAKNDGRFYETSNGPALRSAMLNLARRLVRLTENSGG